MNLGKIIFQRVVALVLVNISPKNNATALLNLSHSFFDDTALLVMNQIVQVEYRV